MDNGLSPLLHIGYDNFVVSTNIVALLNAQSTFAKTIIRSIKAEKPRNLIDISGKRKGQTLIICTGDRYFITSISRIQLKKRLVGESEQQA